jgi:hypothetical protein
VGFKFRGSSAATWSSQLRWRKWNEIRFNKLTADRLPVKHAGEIAEISDAYLCLKRYGTGQVSGSAVLV